MKEQLYLQLVIFNLERWLLIDPLVCGITALTKINRNCSFQIRNDKLCHYFCHHDEILFYFYHCFTPNLMTFTGVTNVHVPLPQPKEEGPQQEVTRPKARFKPTSPF